MRLVSFSQEDMDVLLNWVHSPELNHLWSGDRFTFPLDKYQLSNHLICEEVTPMILHENGQRFGYIELFRESATTYRLCRVLIGEPSSRGKGHGRRMVELAIEHARTQLNAENLKLTVFEHNRQARRCYESLGFEVYERKPGFVAANGESWTALYMKKVLTA
ncbi:GNAT family N-acetyltransferase [Photobacterium rosenbergii]|uniref:GNAT family N-acetyltransferase n=1 Tax=Photobacterium rosenbergii TaxID=294936 RepID=A0ABU3ZJD7_9GAMM|nr:GNAT family N-acetyltransferase [Photobacterium rosenbergii]MDV5170238.1 GNAT family N-acetyltransferase [Photobacterium rosenbergii]